MPPIDVLLSEIRQVLQDAASFGYNRSSKDYDVYEGYIWAKITEAAKFAHWNVTYENSPSDKSGSQHLKFRRAPGVIWSTAAYSYAILSIGKEECMELHLGICMSGNSSADHEFDIALISRTDAIAARQAGQSPPASSAILHVEAKYHANLLKLSVAREMLGYRIEFEPHCDHFLISKSRSSNQFKDVLRNKVVLVDDFFPFTQSQYALESCLHRFFSYLFFEYNLDIRTP